MKKNYSLSLKVSTSFLVLICIVFSSFAPLNVNEYCPPDGKPFDLNVGDFALSLNDLEDHSKKFYKEFGYVNGGNTTLNFASPQVTPIKKTILRTIQNDTPADRCVVPGIRFYFGLDSKNGRIIHYAVSDYLYLENADLNGTNAVFSVGNDASDLIAAIEKNLSIYKFDTEGNAIPLKGNNEELLKAENSWLNYMANIRIDRVLFGGRRFTPDKDISSVFYSLEELEAFCLSEPDLTYFIAENCVRRINTGFKNVIHLSHRNVVRAGTNAKDGLDKVSPVSANEIAAFKDKAADYAQLCPTKCGRIAAKYLSDKTFTLSKD